MKVLLSNDAIQARVVEMGREIARDYAGREPHLVGVLKGACTFMTDLARAIDLLPHPRLHRGLVLRRGHEVVRRGEAGQGPRPGARRPRPAGGGGHRRHRPDPQLPPERAARPRAAHPEGRGPALQAVAPAGRDPRRLRGVHASRTTSSWATASTTTRSTATCATSWCTEARPSHASGQTKRRARNLGQATQSTVARAKPHVERGGAAQLRRRARGV